MKRIAILSLALAAMGAGCWSAEPTPAPIPTNSESPAVMEPINEAPIVAPPVNTSGTVTQPVTPTTTATPPVAERPDNDEVYATVEMSQSGFKPAQITIKQNTIIRFKNVGQTNMWPASNSHPTHTDYPDFDARRNVKPGETYEFRFKNVGAWGCHDHLSPGLTCRIVVTE